MSDEIVDEAARYAAQRANERITDHVTSCATQYDRIDNAFKKNDESHNRIIRILDERLVTTVTKDRFTATERIVWGLVAAVGLAIVAALMSVVLKAFVCLLAGV
jgi:hypothetical protein